MFGPVVTTEAHLAFSGARTHSNNTAEMTAMIEALSFPQSRGPGARDMDSCFYYDSKHAAGVPGHDPSPHSCSAGACMSAVDVMRPAQATAHHATRVRPQRESK